MNAPKSTGAKAPLPVASARHSATCANCNRAMKKFSGVNRMFKGRYIISDATVYSCGKCGEEHIEANEYERIRRKINSIEAKAQLPAMQAVMAKAKFLVL